MKRGIVVMRKRKRKGISLGKRKWGQNGERNKKKGSRKGRKKTMMRICGGT